MSIRKLALLAAVIAGTIGFAGKADAQVIYTGGYYTTPVVYSAYYAPAYTYTPGVAYTSYYTPSDSGWYWDGYRYPYYTGYSYPYQVFSGPGLYVGPRGARFNAWRGWRWW